MLCCLTALPQAAFRGWAQQRRFLRAVAAAEAIQMAWRRWQVGSWALLRACAIKSDCGKEVTVREVPCSCQHPPACWARVQVSQRVAVRVAARERWEAQQAELDAERRREEESFEAIQAEFGMGAGEIRDVLELWRVGTSILLGLPAWEAWDQGTYCRAGKLLELVPKQLWLHGGRRGSALGHLPCPSC